MPTKLTGKTVVFTGTLSMSRNAATAMAVNAGATVTGSVSGNTDILIAGPGAGSKMQEAKAKGVAVWTEEEFVACASGGAKASAPKVIPKAAKLPTKRTAEVAAQSVLSGKTIVFTGSLVINRSDATKLATAAGAKVSGSVSGNTDIVVAGPGAGSKIEMAKAKGTTVWTEQEFMAHVGAPDPHAKKKTAAQMKGKKGDDDDDDGDGDDIDEDAVYAEWKEFMKAEKKAIIGIDWDEKVEFKEDNRFASKLGGIPFWASNVVYDYEGLRLVAQINFKHLPPRHGVEGLPSDGILQFFIADDDDCFGLDFEGGKQCDKQGDKQDNKSFRVKYWPGKIVDSVELLDSERMRGVHPKPKSSFIFDGIRKFKLTTSVSYPGTNCMEFDKHFEKFAAKHYPKSDKDNLRDAISEGFSDESAKDSAQLGGYPSFVQGDIRTEGGEKGSYQLLFQLDSKNPVCIGDCGIMNFFIQAKDLAKKDFSNVLYNWDCG